MNGCKLATSNKQLTGELATLVERKVPASNTLKKQTAPELRTHQKRAYYARVKLVLAELSYVSTMTNILSTVRALE